MSKVFLALWWRPWQNRWIDKIQTKDNIQLLNLEEFTAEELQLYLDEQDIRYPGNHENKNIEFNLKEYVYSWGIVCEFQDEHWNTSLEFILSFYLDTFLSPIFRFDAWGCKELHPDRLHTYKDWYLPLIDIHKLCDFFKAFKWIIDYSYWLRPRVLEWIQSWSDERFRFYYSVWLYSQLWRNYGHSKSNEFWEKEVMEIAIIFEMLFTRTNEKRRIEKYLEDRVYKISLDMIDDVEQHMIDIYRMRSNYAHGSFFEKAQRRYALENDEGWNQDLVMLPDTSMFDQPKLYNTILRKSILLYFLLFQQIRNGLYDRFFEEWKDISCIDVIEKSDTEAFIKQKIQENNNLLSWLLIY